MRNESVTERYKNILSLRGAFLALFAFRSVHQARSQIPLLDPLIGFNSPYRPTKIPATTSSRGMISLIHDTKRRGKIEEIERGKKNSTFKSVVMDDFKSPPIKLIEGPPPLLNVE